MSNSENRKKTKIDQVRLTPEEREELEIKAAAYGVSRAHLMRAGALDMRLTSVVDREGIESLDKAVADLGRLGGLFKHWLTGEMKSPAGHVPQIMQLLRDIEATQKEAKAAILKISGKRKKT